MRTRSDRTCGRRLEASDMDWRHSPEQAGFRSEVLDVVRNRFPARYREMADSGDTEGRQWEWDRKSTDPDVRRAATDWHRALAERGWVAPQWPREYGGGGLTAMEQFILNQEL